MSDHLMVSLAVVDSHGTITSTSSDIHFVATRSDSYVLKMVFVGHDLHLPFRSAIGVVCNSIHAVQLSTNRKQ